MLHSERNLRDILAHAELYWALNESQLDRMTAATQCLRLEKDAMVARRGETSSGIYWIVYGQVSLSCVAPNGSEKVIAFLGGSKCFGMGEMLLDKPFLTSIQTTDDAMLLLTRQEALMQIAQENFAFAREIMTCMGRQYYTLMADIESYSLYSARQRLVQFLVRQSGRQRDAGLVELRANKNLIASLLNLQPETLSRLFRDLSAEGVIEVVGKQIRILDRARMELLIA